MPLQRDNRQKPWPTDYILSESDCRYHGTVAPDEPKNLRVYVPEHLRVYVPEQWAYKADWHAARSTIAHSLGRRCLPEIEAMIGRGPLAHYVGE
jgi:hypothetical protein